MIIAALQLNNKITAPVIDREALAYYLQYQFVPKPMSLIGTPNPFVHENVTKGITRQPVLKNPDLEQLKQQLRQELISAVEKCLPPGDEPVGLLLSGGLDSAVLLWALRQATTREIHTVTGVFEGRNINLQRARELVDKFGTKHNEVVFRADDLRCHDDIYDLGISQPIGDNGLLTHYLMMKVLSDQVSTVFTGDGADCLFGGLSMHRRHLQENVAAAEFEHYRFGETFIDGKEGLKLIFGEQGTETDLSRPLQAVSAEIHAENPVQRQALLDLNFLVRNRLDYVTESARVNGVTAAVPFLEENIVRFALSIPPELLITDTGEQKYILRTAFKGQLPSGLATTAKEGFEVPFKEWYYHNRDYLVRKLRITGQYGISDDYIKHVLKDIKNSDRYVSAMRIWVLLNFACWCDAGIRSS